jgi:hypothetical protein
MKGHLPSTCTWCMYALVYIVRRMARIRCLSRTAAPEPILPKPQRDGAITTTVPVVTWHIGSKLLQACGILPPGMPVILLHKCCCCCCAHMCMYLPAPVLHNYNALFYLALLSVRLAHTPPSPSPRSIQRKCGEALPGNHVRRHGAVV